MSSTEVQQPRSQRDKFLVMNKDPNYQYRWINKNLDHHVSEKLSEGWEPVRGSDLPEDLRNEILGKVGQSTTKPAGGPLSCQQSGDPSIFIHSKLLWNKELAQNHE